MQEDLVIKLSEFGFTKNQAKVYITIIESGTISVGRIAKNTQLHVQDIYKILPKLEKMGLIARTLEKPVQIKAIPIEKAFAYLISIEKDKAEKRISHLECNFKDLIDSIKKFQLPEMPDEDACFVSLTTAKQIKNQADVAFGNALSTCDLVINLDLVKPLLSRLLENAQRHNNRGVKIRLIIESPLPLENAFATFQKALPKNVNLTAKYVNKMQPVPYYVIDQTEVWISMEKETEIGLPRVLWTNGKNIVHFFQESFNEAWNKPNALQIHPPRESCELCTGIIVP
ncbi:MAG: TrmB family transcriptional regulator [Candidatus Bathyarchaeia archaeon]|jgi:sugar-specific transcriptional regulator TrmB